MSTKIPLVADVWALNAVEHASRQNASKAAKKDFMQNVFLIICIYDVMYCVL